jgi:citrate lyase subunit beta/citryl-CoA lyase
MILPRWVGGAPDGVLLPKCTGGHDIATLDHYLCALERREEVAAGSIKIMPVATETAAAMFEMGSYRNAGPRLFGLTWGAEDLSTALGASANKDPDGAYAFPYQLARSLCLIGAKAAGVHAVDTVYPDFRDIDGLAAEVRAATPRWFRREARDPSRPDRRDQRGIHTRREGGRAGACHCRGVSRRLPMQEFSTLAGRWSTSLTSPRRCSILEAWAARPAP